MFGLLIDRLDDPKVAEGLLGALGEPSLLERLVAAAAATNRQPADILAATVRGFLDGASDDHWLQLIGLMNRAEDPGLAALRAILKAALPTTQGSDPSTDAARQGTSLPTQTESPPSSGLNKGHGG